MSKKSEMKFITYCDRCDKELVNKPVYFAKIKDYGIDGFPIVYDKKLCLKCFKQLANSLEE